MKRILCILTLLPLLATAAHQPTPSVREPELKAELAARVKKEALAVDPDYIASTNAVAVLAAVDTSKIKDADAKKALEDLKAALIQVHAGALKEKKIEDEKEKDTKPVAIDTLKAKDQP